MSINNEMSISVIMPCFKGEEYIERSIREAEKEFIKFIDAFEIIVVADGIIDKTMEIASRMADEYGNIKVCGYEKNRGKGYAIRYGMKKASGEYAFMLDSDLDYDPSSLNKFLVIAKESEADIVVGNRRDARSIFVYPLARKITSFIFNGYVNILFRDLDIPDTQAGVKLLKTEVIKRDLFTELEKYTESDGFVFDVCLLVLARRNKLKIASSPCIFQMRSSTIGIGTNYLRTSYKMWKDVLAFKQSSYASVAS
jgi:glycosyltransferase involved in cell wall biosynthesis